MNSQCHVRIIGPALPGAKLYDRVTWLRSCDFEAFHGIGHVVHTSRRSEAMVFDSFRDALAFTQRTPQCRPLRPDGKPNKPLTAYHLEIIGTDTEPTPL